MRKFLFLASLAAISNFGPAAAQTTGTLQSHLANSPNPHVRGYAGVLSQSIWNQRNIFVCWENPETAPDADLELVKNSILETWQAASGLTFSGWKKCAKNNKGIRIKIEDSGPHTKGLGNQLDGREAGMVLNFTFENWSEGCKEQRNFCIKSIAVHEFGHALGFTHEQNRYDAPGECRKRAQATDPDRLLTPYDKSSVMNYCNVDYNNNGKLSPLDISAVQFLYGSPNDRVVKLK